MLILIVKSGADVFLQSYLVSLAFNNSGTLGSSDAAPAGFFKWSGASKIGFYGHSVGANLADVILPGTPEESMSIGSVTRGVTRTYANSGLTGVTEIAPVSSQIVGTGAVLQAQWIGRTASGLEITQVVSLDISKSYIQFNITVKNISSDVQNDVKYMRSLDPDQGMSPSPSNSFETFNRLISQHAGDHLVAAYTAAGSSPFFFYTSEDRGKVAYGGFANRNPYESTFADPTLAEGSSSKSDIGITINFSLGTLAPGQSTNFTYYEGLAPSATFSPAELDTFARSIAFINNIPALTGAVLPLAHGQEDTPYVVTRDQLLSGFSDLNSDSLEVTDLTGDHGAVITANPDGSYSIRVPNDYFGIVSLSYQVADGRGGKTPATQSYMVDSVNDAPVLTGEVYQALSQPETDHYVTYTREQLLQGYTDADGDTLQIDPDSFASGSGYVSLTEDGHYVFYHFFREQGGVTFSYNIIDGNGGVAAASQLVQFTNVNRAPEGTPNPLGYNGYNGTEDTPITLDSYALLDGMYDPDHDGLFIVSITADHGTVETVTDMWGSPSYMLTPEVNYNGVITLTYGVSDGHDTTVVINGLTFDPVNDAPVVTGTQSILAHGQQGSTYTVTTAQLLAGVSDADNDTLSVSDLSSDHGTVVDNHNGTFTITNAATYFGSVALNYTVSDGHGGTLAASESFVIDHVNHAPVLSGTQSALSQGTEDTAYTVTVAQLLSGFSDGDADTLSVTGLSANHAIVTDNHDGTFTLTPAGNYNGPLTLGYTVSDGNGGSLAATQTLNLAAVNDAPSLTGSQSVLSHGIASVTQTLTKAQLLAGFSDIDAGDVLALANVTANNATLVANLDGTYSLTPLSAGTAQISYMVTDGHGGNIASSLSLTVDAVIANSNSTSYQMNAWEKDIILTGTANIDGTGNELVNTITGNSGDNIISGRGGNDKLYGLDGNDILNGGDGDDRLFGGNGNDGLNGGSGADYMEGGAGNDYYVVDNAGDSVVEAANGGYDSVSSSISYLLRANVENLSLSGGANIDGTGNELNNIIKGNSGANILTGKDGNDTLFGLGGNDVLSGGNGNDKLTGGEGSDILYGGAGSDTFIFEKASTNGLDYLKDFVSGFDKLGFIAGDYFAAGHVFVAADLSLDGVAHGTNAQFIYDPVSHTLKWDPDGTGSSSVIALANLGTGTVTHADFMFV